MQILAYRRLHSVAGDENDSRPIAETKDFSTFDFDFEFSKLLMLFLIKCKNYVIITVASLLEFGIIHLDDQSVYLFSVKVYLKAHF